MAGAHPVRKVILFLGSLPERGVCSQSPDKKKKKTAPLIDSCSRQSSSRGTDGIPTQELAEALLQGCLLTGRLALAAQAGSLTEMEHLLLPDTCPELAAGCVSQLTGCPGWRETTGKLHLQRYDESQLAGGNPLLTHLHLLP